MTCEEIRELIGPYQDGELAAERNASVANHLEHCPACKALLERNLSLSRSIREFAPTYSAPSSLIAKTRASGTRPLPFLAGAFFGAATAFLLAWLLFARPVNDITSALVSDHVRSLMANHLIDIPSSDKHTVKPWFLGKLDFSPAVPDLSAEGFPLLGGRLEYIAGQEAAALVYESGKHKINVFVMKESPRESGHELDGYHVLHWDIGGLSYWAVSDVEKGQLERFSAEFQRRA